MRLIDNHKPESTKVGKDVSRFGEGNNATWDLVLVDVLLLPHLDEVGWADHERVPFVNFAEHGGYGRCRDALA